MPTYPTRRSPFGALIALVLLLASFTRGQSAEIVTFQIGEIPPQRIWYGENARIRFAVRADALSENAVIRATFQTEDGIEGQRTFDPVGATFTYVPAITDAEPFDVTFTAEGAGTSAAQKVTFTPLLPLVPETSVLSLAPRGNLPDPESDAFLSVETAIENGPANFNAADRPSLRDVTIVGKTVVFEEGHANALWGFHDNEDIRSMTIHAETLIIRGALKLPQTELGIYATEVRFEDSEGVVSSVSTEPRSSALRPAKFADGTDGHDAGSLTAFAHALTAEGSAPRFHLLGGNGRPAGPGEVGAKGASRATYDVNGNPDTSGSYIFLSTTISHPFGNITLTIPAAGDPGFPGDGKPGKTGGLPGRAGDGGSITSNLDLSVLVLNSGGAQGTIAATASGGAGGSPRTALKRYLPAVVGNTSRNSQNGASAVGRDSDKKIGNEGAVTVLEGDLRWLSPFALEKTLLHLKQAYLDQHFDFVRMNLADTIELIELAMATDAWADLADAMRDDLLQILDEMRTLAHRIGSNLDYFGNPAGWVPMLSFEVNKLAFENEIPRALRVMYLNYWLRQKAESLQDKVSALMGLRVQLAADIANDRAEYQQVVAAIPGLEFEAQRLQDRIGVVKLNIEAITNALLPKAKSNVRLRKIAQAFGFIAEIFPIGQPFVGQAGSAVSQIANADPNKPIGETALSIGVGVAGEFARYEMSRRANEQRFEAGEIDLEDLEGEENALRRQRMRELQGPIMDALGDTVNLVRNSQSPSSEVEAELQRLLAEEPGYQALVKDLRKLHQEKTAFAVELAQTMQKVANLTLAISRNLVTLDVLNRNIQDDRLVLDARTVSTLDAMNQRARDRLLKYHYFMARAFEYRMLKRYEGELDLNGIFDKFGELAAAGDTPVLTPEQFEALQGIYEEQISSVVFSILEEYNSDRPDLSAPVRLSVPQDILDQLNAGETAILNLDDRPIFLPNQENVRIVDLQVIELEVEYTGKKEDVFYADIVFQHSGISPLQNEGETYLFRHYNQETRSKIEWSSRFDPFDRSLDPVRPSAAEQSLLKALLSTGSSTPSTEDLLLYSRPAAKADLLVSREVSAEAGAGVTITNMRIELIYDFSRKNEQIKTLEVVADPEGAQPRVKIGRKDLNERQDGEGSFERSYDIGSVVTLEAPEKFGLYVFDGWKGAGVTDPDSPFTTVVMNANTEVQPTYRAVVPYLVQVIGGTGGGTYINGETVPIAAAVPEGYRFVRWEGSGITDPNAATTTLTVSSDSAVEAIYAALKAISTWLGNISTRAQVGTGPDILIPGFVIEGDTAKKLLIRAVGPKLDDFGVTGFLKDPILQVLNSNKEIIGTNDNWETAANLDEMLAAFGLTGAFDLSPESKDASALVTLQPGAYTVKVSGVGATTGVSLVEVYDADGNADGSRLVNISGRAQVGVGADVLIPGFVVDGEENKQYLIRAIGPTLAGFNVTGFLEDPTLTVFQDKVAIVTNDDWGQAANLADLNAAATRVGAFDLGDGSKDAAALVTLEAGRYTIKVSGVGATSGVALVEVYEVVQP